MKVSHIPPFGVRMPQELKVKIEEAAKKAGRSINAEIVYRLQKSIEDEQQNQDAISTTIFETTKNDDFASLINKLNLLGAYMDSINKELSAINIRGGSDATKGKDKG